MSDVLQSSSDVPYLFDLSVRTLKHFAKVEFCNLYGAIWAKCPSVAYLEGRTLTLTLKSNKYGTSLDDCNTLLNDIAFL